MTSVKLAWGKGGGEYYTAQSVSEILSIPIREDNNYQTVTKHNYELLQTGMSDKIAALRQETYAAAQNITNIVDCSSAYELAFNPDFFGGSGNRSDLVILSREGTVIAGISSKHNNPEKGSIRYNQNKDVSPITGQAYSGYAMDIMKVTWTKIYDQPRMPCRDRKDLPILIDQIVDTEVGELYWSIRHHHNALCNHLTTVAFGNNPEMIEVTYRYLKRGYVHNIATDFPKITKVFDPKVIASGDSKISRTLQIPVLTNSDEKYFINIRFKNGSEHTHYESGTPKTFLKTSVTRKIWQ